MSQLPLFRGTASPDPQPETQFKSKFRSSHPKQVKASTLESHRITSSTIWVQVDAEQATKPSKLTPYKLCRVLGRAIAFSKVDIAPCADGGWINRFWAGGGK